MDYRREIDGLRALAVIPVILFHAGFRAFDGGFVGVDVFFVISGYLITGIIIKDQRDGTFSLTRFYERRARRILPALFLVMLASLPFAWALLFPSHMRDYAHSLIAVPVFASNILFWRESGYFDVNADLKPLLHTWSLGVEEQFYLLYPLCLLLIWRLGRRSLGVALLIVAVASLALAQWGAVYRPSFAFYLLPTRAWELMLGALVAIYLSNRPREPAPGRGRRAMHEALATLGLGLIIVAVFAFDPTVPVPSLYALVPTCGTALIILFASSQTMAGRMLGAAPLVGIGLISYSAYLWHQPLFAFSRHWSFDEPSAAVLSALAVAALGLAYLSWRYVELPFRDRQRIGRSTMVASAAAASALFVGVGLAGTATSGFQFRYSPAIVEIDKTAKREKFCHLLSRRLLQLGACAVGDGPIVGAMIGDSHADALAAELGRQLGRSDRAFWVFMRSGCPLSLTELKPAKFGCADFIGNATRYIEGHPEVSYVVLVSRWTVYAEGTRFDNMEGGLEKGDPVNFKSLPGHANVTPQAVTDAYAGTIADYLGQGRTVFLVYPIPEVGWEVPRGLLRHYQATGQPPPADFLSTSAEVFRKRNKTVIDAFDRIEDHANLVRIRPDEIFCDSYVPGRCVVQIDGVPLYYDDNHLGDLGARLVIEQIMKHIDTMPKDKRADR